MKNNYKKIFLSTVILWVLSLSILFIFLPKKEISKKERRKLATINISDINKPSFVNDMDKYLQDHFPMRDVFLKIKSASDGLKLQSNGYATINDYIFKIPKITSYYGYKKTANHYDKLINEIFKNNKKYLSLIPDKNYYIKNSIYPKIDYEGIKKIFTNELKDYDFIELRDSLELKDYYKSDLHWKQENLLEVSKKLASSLSREFSDEKYEIERIGEFFGSYGSASGKPNILDDLNILKNNKLNNYEVKDLITEKTMNFYNKELFNSIDPYNVYLDGPKPLIEIKSKDFNEKSETLYIFRDSFTSSLAPLLSTNFDRIVLVDSRYVSSKYLIENIKPKDDDKVLILLSYEIIKDSSILK